MRDYPEYLKDMTFKKALAYTELLLSDKNLSFEARADIADDFASYYPYFNSAYFDKYFLDD